MANAAGNEALTTSITAIGARNLLSGEAQARGGELTHSRLHSLSILHGAFRDQDKRVDHFLDGHKKRAATMNPEIGNEAYDVPCETLLPWD